jgi:hypothetical protein
VTDEIRIVAWKSPEHSGISFTVAVKANRHVWTYFEVIRSGAGYISERVGSYGYLKEDRSFGTQLPVTNLPESELKFFRALVAAYMQANRI